MKKIKFNLQINGKTCFNIEQLRDNFNINDVVELFDKGVLKRWLSIHNLKELEDKVSSIDINTSLDNKVRELTLIFFEDTNKAEEIIKKYFEELELKKQQETEKANQYNLRNYYEQYIKDYDKAIELAPNTASLYSERGDAKKELEQYEEAIRDYDKAIELNRYNEAFYFDRGFCKSILGKKEEAMKDYNKVIKLNPYNEDFYIYRGNVNEMLGNLEEAIKDYQKAMELIELNTNRHIHDKERYLKLDVGRYKDYDKLLELYNKDTYNYCFRGIIKYKLEKYEEAIKNYDKAIELNPNNAYNYYFRGNAEYELKMYEKSIKDYDKAIKLGISLFDIYTSMDNAKSQLKNIKKLL
ncbi:tetratricopeptide repeat protein [Brachyspira pulli]|uniref:tetratricopeptide repeat protein n=1 Tax=Brachyspira pulli TaxID=310721 RepID=UPI003004B32A